MQLGDPDLNDLVLIASISPAEWDTAMDRAQATPVVKAKLRLIYKAAVLRCGAAWTRSSPASPEAATTARASIWAQWSPEEWRAYWAQWSPEEWQDWRNGPATVRRAWRHHILASLAAASSSSVAPQSAAEGGKDER